MSQTLTHTNTIDHDLQGFEKYMLELSNITKVYPTPKGDFVVLENLNLKIKEGEFVSIIGHSGCGKTTLLSMIAGLNPITSGEIILDGTPIKGPGPDRGVIFQSPSLLPWMSAMENVQLGVDKVFANATKKQREDICKYYLSKVGLDGAFDKKAKDLSQGMKQRVGIARALALKPQVLLLDEPFGMLDSLTRGELQDVLLEVLDKEKTTGIMITHDVDESIFLADRVIMMTSGPRAQIGDILDITYDRPRNRKAILEHETYYSNREHLINFLEH
ncbi:ABC transporter ATP-binding protein [Flavobacterium algicola]|nr:ABC transporter ATP-binding protein [Flavobacterium algicola]MCG9793438.1 ABC transporter ATP-binding protein [Flavobacterium algicola]